MCEDRYDDFIKEQLDDDLFNLDDSLTDREKKRRLEDFMKKKSNAMDKPKKVKEKKKFNIGDVIVANNLEIKKLPIDAHEFLMLYGKFTVEDVSESGNLYLGFSRISDTTGKMEKFWFSPNRFDLKKETIVDDFDFDED